MRAVNRIPDPPWAGRSRSSVLTSARVHYMFKTGGARGMALGEAMTERFFRDLVECGAEAVVP